ncbi:MAG: hypothetical protein JW819_05315 [Candidatus Krumholzibacteriota bacterium]|nr:hypothetical protein [Candidatus Krumholzibacteriota bacterium]
MKRAILVLILSGLLIPMTATAGDDAPLTGTAVRDSLWYAGHEYRQWIYDQNSIDDRNSNLDPDIDFIAAGRIRVHPNRVYFYNDLDLAVRISAETKIPLALYLFDHTCRDCLYRLPSLYTDSTLVAASRDFINVYVEIPKEHRRCLQMGIMESSLTVQFFLPGLRRLRVVDDPDRALLLETYGIIRDYAAGLTDEQMMEAPRRPSIAKPVRSAPRGEKG